MKAFALLFLLFIGIFSAEGQNLFFEKVNEENVVIDSPVQNIAKDSLGYIWVATWNGLFKYDGSSFEIFKHNTKSYNNIPDSRIRNLIVDDQKQLWLLTYEKKHIKYDYGTSRFHIVKDTLKLGKINHDLYLNSNQLNRHKVINGYSYFITNRHFASLNVNTMDTVIYGPDYSLSGNLPDEIITCYYIDDQNLIWIGTQKGNLYKVNLNRLPFNLHYVYNQKNNHLVQCQVSSIARVNNQIWVGTLNNGIFLKENEKAQRWKHAFTEQGHEYTSVLALLHDKANNVWIGTRHKGLWYYDLNRKKLNQLFDQTTPNAYLTDPYVSSIIIGHDQSVIAGSYKGLFKINPQTKAFRRIDLHQLLGVMVKDIIEDSDHKIWVATDGYCAFRFGFDENMKCIDTLIVKDFSKTSRHYEGEHAYCLLDDHRGFVWVGTSEGLYRINRKDLSVTPFTKEDGLSDDYICAIEEDWEGNLWVSTKKGLSKIHRLDQSISSYSISDQWGKWVFMDGSSFKDSLRHHIYFGSREGYVSFNPELIHAPRFSPRMVLEGFYVNGKQMHPGDSLENRMILKQSIAKTDEIALPYSNDFSVRFSSLNFQNSSSGSYYYKLEGYNDNWIETKGTMVSFVKVPHGHYLFKVKNISADNIVSDTASFKLTVLAPWYASLWACLFYTVFLVFSIYVISRIIAYQQKLKNAIFVEKVNAEKQEEMNRHKIEFFTSVSHELRTPLTLITDPLKQLLEGNIDEKHRKSYISIIENNVGHLVQLVNQVLDFRRMEVVDVKVEPIAVNIVEVLRKSFHSFDAAAFDRHLELQFNTEVQELYGFFDCKILEQVLINIVSNSLKYTPSYGIISVSLSVSEDCLVIAIRDTGKGMSQEQLNAIFTPFNKKGGKTYWGYSSGIGMALTQKYMELLDGKLSIDSEEGKGTVVHLEIPFKPANKAVQLPVATVEKENYPHADQNEDELKTILIVEDNTDIQKYLQLEFEDCYTVISEYNGIDGLKKAREIIPDLIISDVMMPLMSGLEFCEKVKTDEKTSHIPVILLTAKGTDEDRIAGLQCGADVYVTKPFSIQVLKAQLHSVIDNHEKQQAKYSSKMYLSELETDENQEESRFLKKAVQMVKEHMENEAFNPEELAHLLKLSDRQLYRKLKAVSGSTVNEFIKRVKMEEASDLLIHSDLKIYEIAYKTGFSEASNFSRTFTAHFGCSPTQYVKRH